MRNPARFFTLLLALVAVPALAGCDGTSVASGAQAPAANAPEVPAELSRVDFTIAGMDCAGCVLATRTALGRLEGVQEVSVEFESLDDSPAWAIYDPERVTPDRMIEAIATLGYTATAVESRG